MAPADLPKTDSSLDLAIAAAIFRASGQVPQETLKDTVIIGELGLDGTVRATRGIIGKLLSARKLGIHSFIVPSSNLAQVARIIADLDQVVHIEPEHIAEALQYRRQEQAPLTATPLMC